MLEETAKLTNAKMYWTMLKGSVITENICTLSCYDFQEYFKSVNDPNSIFFQSDEDIMYFNDSYLDGERNIV